MTCLNMILESYEEMYASVLKKLQTRVCMVFLYVYFYDFSQECNFSFVLEIVFMKKEGILNSVSTLTNYLIVDWY